MAAKEPGSPQRMAAPDDGNDPTFRFESFAKSEADAVASEQGRRRRGPTEAPVEKRTILRRSYLPPGDVVVDTRPVGNMTVVTLRGRINEAFRGGELGRSLSGVVVFDLAEVDRVSSFGVKGWLQMLDMSRMSACYFYRCSEAIINQVTMMRNFCGRGRIHSLMVPYACPACGEEFGALYESVADRESLLGRSPARVECPSCHQPARMDDDPWSYFALDEHLLDVVPPDLQQVVDHLSSTNRTDPIEKFISEFETRIRFNAPLDGRLRLRRAFAGLEGRVTLDHSVTPSVDAAGIHRLLGALRDLEGDVSEIWLDGAHPDLVRALLLDPIPRVYASSMFVEARCLANGIRRPVLVDIENQRHTLGNRGLPPIEANWAVGPVDIADTDVLFQAAAQLGPPAHPTAIAPQAYPESARVAAPSHAPGHQPALIFGLQPWQFALGTATASLLAVFVVILAVVWIFAARTEFFSGSGEDVAQAGADGWDGGNVLPPAWVEQQFEIGDALVRVVGRASGSDDQMETLAEQARVDALYELLLNLRTRIEDTRAGPGLADLPPVVEPARVVDRLDRDVDGIVNASRANVAIKRQGDQVTLVTQHVLQRDEWESLLDYYGTAKEFRGLWVNRRFPTDYGSGPGSSTPIVISAVPSWYSEFASPGDAVESIGNVPITSLDQFFLVAHSTFNRLRVGQAMRVTTSHDGKPGALKFTKKPVAPDVPGPLEPEPRPLDDDFGLLPLDEGAP